MTEDEPSKWSTPARVIDLGYGFSWEGGNGPAVEVNRTCEFQVGGSGNARIIQVRSEHHTVEVYVSPKGRKVLVYLDGEPLNGH